MTLYQLLDVIDSIGYKVQTITLYQLLDVIDSIGYKVQTITLYQLLDVIDSIGYKVQTITLYQASFASGNFGESDAWKVFNIFTKSYFHYLRVSR